MIKKSSIFLIICLVVSLTIALIPNKAAEAAGSVLINSIDPNPVGVGKEVFIKVTAAGNQLTGISLYVNGKMDELHSCREGGISTGTPAKSCVYEFKKTFDRAGEYFIKALVYSLNENFGSTPEQKLDVTPTLSGTATISPTTVKAGENFTITVVGTSPTAVSMVANIYPSGAGAKPIASKSCNNAVTCQVSKTQNKSQTGSVSYYGYITAEGGSYQTGLATIDISSAATSPSSPAAGTGQSSGSASPATPVLSRTSGSNACNEVSVCPEGQICNPLKYKSFECLIQAIINDFLIPVGSTVAGVMFVIAGVVFVTSAGDPGRTKTAKDIMLYTAIGLAVVLIASGLVKVLQSLLGGP